ncbi:acyltransferase [Parasulfitobacter algicola]|uniref:Acyltransferase n=1 Tax=Parasulfitobacter algicola TaxID=2614809 RepID=A0ABX2ILV8_9RHOB|nr:acyltransferase [Sulfitobacter algicola]NSX53868.1 acyltransferase [Sulfitobacter algicola]
MTVRFHTPVRKVIWKLQRLFWSGETLARKSGVTLGQNCRILTKDFGSEPFLITIGNNVTVSGDVKFINHDGAGWLVRDQKGRRYSFRPIQIGNDVFIGSGTLLMPGVKIADRVIVAAGSVVTKSIPSGIVIGGRPAKYICDYSDFEQRALDWVSDTDMPDTDSYRNRIEAMADLSFKPEMDTS